MTPCLVRPIAILLAAAAALSAPTALAAQGTGRASLEVGTERSTLSDGYSDWSADYARLHLRASTRAGLAVTGERLERFGLDDRRLLGELSLPLGRRLTLSGTGEASETHRVVPRTAYGGRLHVSLGGGWGVEGGASRRKFDDAEVRATSVGLERYVSRMLLAYAYAVTRLAGVEGDAESHQARVTVFFGERGSVTLGGATGREAESVGGAGVLVMDVEAASLWGVLPVGPSFDLTWAAGTTTQGDLYTRTHLAIGARLRLR